MPDKAPDGWRKATARELATQPDPAEMMAEHIRFTLAQLLTEPLPERMMTLLINLERAPRGPKA